MCALLKSLENYTFLPANTYNTYKSRCASQKTTNIFHHKILHKMLKLTRDMTVKNSLPGIYFRSRDTIQVDSMKQNQKRDNPQIDKSNNTFNLYGQNDSFYTSTPKKLQMDCFECQRYLQGIQVESRVSKWPRTGHTEYRFFGT